MRRKFILALIFLFLLAGSFLLREENQEKVLALPQNFTVPTKTPTSPPPPPPTQDPGDGGGGNNPSPTQPPESTAVPTAIPTAVVIAPTPEGGYLPTAEACSTNPTVTAQTLTNVRAGPGTNYEAIGELVFLEVRPIVGRAGEINWWQISLRDGRIGWVSNAVVQYHGNISVVPVAEAPLLNGVAPTPGTPWTPVLPAGCQPLPVWTPAAEVAVVETEEQPVDVQQEATSEATAVPNTPAPAPTETPIPDAAQTEPTEEIAAVPLVTDNSDAQVAVNQPIPTAAPLPPNNTDAPSSNSLFLVFGSIVLLFVFGMALLRSYQSNKG